MTDQGIKRIGQGVAIALIILAIWYLETNKPAAPSVGGEDIVVATSTTVDSPTVKDRSAVREAKAGQYPRAKEFAQPSGFINTKPFTLASLVGTKVVLVDFWTYSCINCLRTTPYLNAWYEKYKDQGLVIVGIHTPEFDFEKDYDNVQAAVERLGISYPVVLDNEYGTWSAYQNQYWPREYLIDIDGFIVHDHIGEGDYVATEEAIQQALAERNAVLDIPGSIAGGTVSPGDVIPMDGSQIRSPETYFGSSRNEYLGNGIRGQAGVQMFSLPEFVAPNILYLDGIWNVKGEYAESVSTSSSIVYRYSAKNIYIVASARNKVTLKVLLDGKIPGDAAGADVAPDGTFFVEEERLYKLIEGASYGQHTITIQAEESGLQAYTFTFG